MTIHTYTPLCKGWCHVYNYIYCIFTSEREEEDCIYTAYVASIKLTDNNMYTVSS